MTRPYYDSDGVTLYHGDCLDVLPALTPESVDLVLTDPPYGTLDGRGKVQKRGAEHVAYYTGEWDRELPLAWIPLALALLRRGRWLAAFTDALATGRVWDAIERAGGAGKQMFYWVKSNCAPTPRPNFVSSVEVAVCATKGPSRYWHGGASYRNFHEAPFTTSNERATRTGHPTQKPVGVMAALLQPMTAPGDLVLDCFAGSGTTLVAARRFGRRAVGVEVDERYCEMAAKRLSQCALPFSAEDAPAPETSPLFGGAA